MSINISLTNHVPWNILFRGNLSIFRINLQLDFHCYCHSNSPVWTSLQIVFSLVHILLLPFSGWKWGWCVSNYQIVAKQQDKSLLRDWFSTLNICEVNRTQIFSLHVLLPPTPIFSDWLSLLSRLYKLLPFCQPQPHHFL